MLVNFVFLASQNSRFMPLLGCLEIFLLLATTQCFISIGTMFQDLLFKCLISQTFLLLLSLMSLNKQSVTSLNFSLALLFS